MATVSESVARATAAAAAAAAGVFVVIHSLLWRHVAVMKIHEAVSTLLVDSP